MEIVSLFCCCQCFSPSSSCWPAMSQSLSWHFLFHFFTYSIRALLPRADVCLFFIFAPNPLIHLQQWNACASCCFSRFIFCFFSLLSPILHAGNTTLFVGCWYCMMWLCVCVSFFTRSCTLFVFPFVLLFFIPFFCFFDCCLYSMNINMPTTFEVKKSTQFIFLILLSNKKYGCCFFSTSQEKD